MPGKMPSLWEYSTGTKWGHISVPHELNKSSYGVPFPLFVGVEERQLRLRFIVSNLYVFVTSQSQNIMD